MLRPSRVDGWTATVTTFHRNEYARIHFKHKYSRSDGYARCVAVIAATQLEIAASHWRSRHIHSELNPPNLDQMMPNQFHFNVNTCPEPKDARPRRNTTYRTGLVCSDKWAHFCKPPAEPGAYIVEFKSFPISIRRNHRYCLLIGDSDFNEPAEAMPNPKQELAAQGIFSWGSEELVLYERHLTRFFSREYRNLHTGSGARKILQQAAESLPMSEKTERLMEEHYDEPLALFEGFLDRHYMAYTMAWYGEDPDSIRKSEVSLQQAQSQKFALAAERIGLRGAERVLNIGCGFGSLETWLFEHFPKLDLISVTPSRVQADYIRQCIADPEHVMPTNRIKLVEKTFEQLTWQDVGSKPFDLIFAVGVFEHIANLKAAFRKIHDYLRPGGHCFLHLIVSKPVFPQHMNSDNTLIGRYFPGGRIWPYDVLPQAAESLELVGQWYINGTNYWKTLDEWHRQYWEHIAELYPEVLDATAVKYWNDYFVLCKAVLFGPLDGEIYGNGHYVFRRAG